MSNSFLFCFVFLNQKKKTVIEQGTALLNIFQNIMNKHNITFKSSGAWGGAWPLGDKSLSNNQIKSQHS